MKFFKLWFFFLPLFISCSTSSETGLPDDGANASANLRPGTPSVSPVNTANPYDAVGQLHNEVLDAYFSGDSLPKNVSAIISRVLVTCQANTAFTALNSVPYPFSAQARIAYILNNPISCQPEIITASLGSSQARSGFTAFIGSFLALCDSEENYTVIYNFVTAYENTVSADTAISVKDRKTILITTSIARHAAYVRKKKPKRNKDPEWALMVGNLFGALEGASESEQDAVMKALATGVAQNN